MASAVPDDEVLGRSVWGEVSRPGPVEEVVARDARRPSQLMSVDFRCHVTYFDDRARVTVTGRLDVSTVPVVRRLVLAAAVLPISGVTIDLASVESVDRLAIDALVALKEEVRAFSAAFAIASASASVRQAFVAAGVEDRFEYESVWSQYPSTTACA